MYDEPFHPRELEDFRRYVMDVMPRGGVWHRVTRLLATLDAVRQPAVDVEALRSEFESVVSSDPQNGYSRERQRGWDEAVATVRSIFRAALAAQETPPKGDER